MASLSNLYIKLDTLKKLVSVLEKREKTGISLTIALNDETKAYGQNVSAWIQQSKEDREAGKARYFVGNGMTFWTDGNIKAFKYEKPDDDDDDDIPF